MKSQLDIEENIQQIIECLDGRENIDASPFFQIKLEKAILVRSSFRDTWLYRSTLGYKLAPAWLALILILNIVSLSLSITHTHRDENTYSQKFRKAALELYSYPGSGWEGESNGTGN